MPVQPLKINFDYRKLNFKHHKKKIRPVSTWWTGLVLIQNSLKLNFYFGQQGFTRINPVDSVLTKNDDFYPKRPETQFLPQSIWFALYWPDGLSFDQK